MLCEDGNEDNENNVYIDLDIDKSNVYGQMSNILSTLSRSSETYIVNTTIYDMITNKTLSYGKGTFRQIISELKKEANDKLNDMITNPKNYSKFDFVLLGKVIVYLFRDFKEHINMNLHPYFFYLLSNKEKIEGNVLIKYLLDNQSNLLAQFIDYSTNTELLLELDIDDVCDINSYMKYILANDLTDSQKYAYDNIVHGFIIELTKKLYGTEDDIRDNYNFIERIPIKVWIDLLKNPRNKSIHFDINIQTKTKDEADIIYQIFTNILETELSTQKILNLCFNITGSYNYEKNIYINIINNHNVPNNTVILHADNFIVELVNTPTPTQNLDSDVDTLSDESENESTSESSTNNAEEYTYKYIHNKKQKIEKDISNYVANTNSLSYKISTCNASVELYNQNTIDDLRYTIYQLTIVDLHMYDGDY
jgi:hypothetical protein